MGILISVPYPVLLCKLIQHKQLVTQVLEPESISRDNRYRTLQRCWMVVLKWCFTVILLYCSKSDQIASRRTRKLRNSRSPSTVLDILGSAEDSITSFSFR